MIAATKESLMKEVEQVQEAAEGWSPQEALRWAFDTFGNDVAIASALSGRHGSDRSNLETHAEVSPLYD